MALRCNAIDASSASALVHAFPGLKLGALLAFKLWFQFLNKIDTFIEEETSDRSSVW